MNPLSDDEKILVAVALLLLRDYRGTFITGTEPFMVTLEIAKKLGVDKELHEVIKQFPPMRIEEK